MSLKMSDSQPTSMCMKMRGPASPARHCWVASSASFWRGGINCAEVLEVPKPQLWLVRFLGEATDLAECDYVRNKADYEQPWAAFHRQDQAPAENNSDYQIGDYRPKQFHAGILSEVMSPASSEPIIPNAGLGVSAMSGICEVVEGQGFPLAKMVSGTKACRVGHRVDSRARDSTQRPLNQVLIPGSEIRRAAPSIGRGRCCRCDLFASKAIRSSA